MTGFSFRPNIFPLSFSPFSFYHLSREFIIIYYVLEREYRARSEMLMAESRVRKEYNRKIAAVA